MQALIQEYIKVGGWLRFQVGSFIPNIIIYTHAAAEFKVEFNSVGLTCTFSMLLLGGLGHAIRKILHSCDTESGSIFD